MTVPWSPHGELDCIEEHRYWCVLCWTLPCWCKGADDEVEQYIQQHYAVRVPTDDAGICDDCSAALTQGGDLRVERNKCTTSIINAQETEIKKLREEKKIADIDNVNHGHDNDNLRERIDRLEKDVRKKDELERYLNKAKKLVGDRDWKKKVLGEDNETP